MSHKIITICFYILLICTPLFFTPFNNELFEYNKMMLVYALTAFITISWVIKCVNRKSLIVNRTPLDIPLMLFLGSQILSTIFSMDVHTSIWGYYSRSNGGLLSIISYILLYYAFVSNFDSKQAIKFLKAALIGGFAVSLYAIPEHFGLSPSCALLVQRFAADCWVQDVQARVFATLGQPNWLGAYLGMLIFPALYFFPQAKNKLQLTTYYLLLTTYYLAFTFTYSRGAALGLIAGMGVFLMLVAGSRFSVFRSLLASFQSTGRPKADKLNSDNRQLKTDNLKPILIVLLLFLIVNLLFGSSLTRFKLIAQNITPPKPQAQASTTQLESGGTESGQIRLIVWKGALEIFKHYPILGSGVETFAYSYYNFRPIEHNFVSEWDFLYNKAHNEYLNYLATTGALGFASYMAVIVTFIFWCIKQKKLTTDNLLLITSLLAGYISYLVQNFFGFSVVIIALLFFLFPAFAFVFANATKPISLPKQLYPIRSTLYASIYKRDIYRKILIVFLIIILITLTITLGRLWIADTFYKNGSDYSDSGNPGRAYNYLVTAVRLNSGEPLYRSELGFAAASAALSLASEEATTSTQLKNDAETQTKIALNSSPKNVSLWRTAIRTYFQLASLDPKFETKTIEAIDKSITLAPTDPKLYYNKGLVLNEIGKKDEAIKELQKAVELRPNYAEAYFTLGGIYKELNQKDKAIEVFEQVLKVMPGNEGAIKQIEELGK